MTTDTKQQERERLEYRIKRIQFFIQRDVATHWELDELRNCRRRIAEMDWEAQQ